MVTRVSRIVNDDNEVTYRTRGGDSRISRADWVFQDEEGRYFERDPKTTKERLDVYNREYGSNELLPIIGAGGETYDVPWGGDAYKTILSPGDRLANFDNLRKYWGDSVNFVNNPGAYAGTYGNAPAPGTSVEQALAQGRLPFTAEGVYDPAAYTNPTTYDKGNSGGLAAMWGQAPPLWKAGALAVGGAALGGLGAAGGLSPGVSAGGLAGELGIAGGLGAGELGAVAAGGGLAGELGSMANYFPGVGTSFPATSSIEQMIAALSNGQGLAVGNLGTTAQAANIGNLASGIGAGAGAAGGGGGGFLNAIQNYFTNPANIASSAASTGLQTALGSGGGGATEDAAGNLYNPSDPSNPIPRTTTASGGNNFLAKMLASSGAGATSQFLKSMGIDISPSALGLLGNIGSTALGVYGANQQSNALTDIANQARADRQPFLQSATDMLNNPDDYYKRPEVTGSVDAILRGLSAKVGNPFGHPAALGQAAAYNLGGYNNALGQRAALGLGGQDTISRLQTNAATGQGNVYNALGSGLGSMLSTQPNINALLSEYLARQI